MHGLTMKLINRIVFIPILAMIILTNGCVRPNRQPDLPRIFKTAAERKGKIPIIIIPGILGSRLKTRTLARKSGQNSATPATIWICRFRQT